MKRMVRLSAVAMLFATGCGYRGAVYSSYQQLALDIRATTESSTPVKVQLGYDRGVGAWVPKLNAGTRKSATATAPGTDRGEAVSIISKDDIRTTVTPPIKAAADAASAATVAAAAAKPTDQTTGGYKVLKVDSAFITGMAANVAAAPADTEVRVVVPPAAGADGRAATALSVTTKGDAGLRIATALSSAESFDALQTLYDKIGTLDPARQEAVYDAAAELVSPRFHELYAKYSRRRSHRVAFLVATGDYNHGPTQRRELIAALRNALE